MAARKKLWESYLDGLLSTPATAAQDPTIQGYQNATARALALGLSNTEGQHGGGWLSKALMPLDWGRGLIYAGGTELSDLVTGRGWNADDFKDKFGRAVRDGEGFGSTDFLSVDEGDNILEKAAKFGGSFAADVVSDPLNWVTLGTATLPKAAVGSAAKASAEGAFKEIATEVAQKAGKELAEDAAGRVTRDLAARQLRFSGGVLEDELGDTLARRAADLEGLAKERLADVIGTARTLGTGRTVTAAVRQELLDLGIDNADELALRVVRGLPRELRGGLGVQVPFTSIGFDLTKGGGSGTDLLRLGRVADATNSGRAGARAALRGPTSLVSKLGGESGQLYGDLLRGVRNAEGKTLAQRINTVLRTPGAVTSTDLTGLVDGNALKKVARNEFINLGERSVIAARGAVDDFGNREQAEAILKASFHDYGLDDALAGVNRADPRVQRLIAAGTQMRDVFKEAAELRGFRVDPDSKYVPRLVKVDEYNRRKLRSSAAARTVGDSNPGSERYAYYELLAELGDDNTVKDFVRRDLSAPEINKLSGREVVEEDPFTIMARAVERDAAAIESKVLADVLKERGLLVADPRRSTATVGEIRDKVSKAGAAAVRSARSLGDRLAAEADDAAGALDVARAGLAQARAAGDSTRQGLRAEADRLGQVLKTAEADASVADGALTEADRALRTLAGSDERAIQLRNLMSEMTSDEATAVRQAAAAASDLEAKKAIVADLKSQRAKLIDDARRSTAAERQAKTTVEKSERLAVAAAARRNAAQGAERQFLDELDTINKVVDSGNWEEAARLYRDMYLKYRDAGANQAVLKNLLRGRNQAKRLGLALEAEARAGRLIDDLGLVTLASEKGATRIPRPFEGFLAGQGISDALDTMYSLGGSSTGLRKALDPYLDPYMRSFRTWATLGRGPGYHVRNNIGAMVNNWLLGVKGVAVKPAYRISRAIEQAKTQIDKAVASGALAPLKAEEEFHRVLRQALSWDVGYAGTTAYDIARGFLAEGVQYARTNELLERSASDAIARAGESRSRRVAGRSVTPDTAAAVRRGGARVADTMADVADSRIVTDNWWLRSNAFAAEESERFHRLAAYIEGYARYQDQSAAGLFAKAGHFDYQDLTETEKAIKFVAPFYTWTRYNVPFQLRQAINNPGSLNRLDALATNLQAAFGDPNSDGLVPDWIKDRFGFETPVSLPGGGKLAVMVESPQLDIFELLGDGGKNPVDIQRLFESVNPVLKTAFEVGQGKTTFGGDIDALTTVRNLVPPAGQALRLTGATGKDREKTVGSWLGFLGAPVTTITDSAKRGEARVQTGRISKSIDDALAPYLAEGEEVDTRWLTEMAASGRSPAEILSLIKAGYGRKGSPKAQEETAATRALRIALGN